MDTKQLNLIHEALESTQDLKEMNFFIAISSMQVQDASVDIFNRHFPLVREALALFEEESE